MPLNNPQAYGMGEPIGPLLTQPQVPPPGAAIADPQKVGLWRRFQDRLAADPNLRMALLTAGLNMMRSPQPGQTGFDVFSNAALQGVGTLDQLRQRELEQRRLAAGERRADERLGLEERRTATGERQAASSAARVEQLNRQHQDRMKVAMDQLAEDKRQFDEGLAAGKLSQTTGAERMEDSLIKALQTAHPEAYPQTPEGKAAARIAARTYDASDPLSMTRMVVSLLTEMTKVNQFSDKPLSPEALAGQAESTVRGIAERLGLGIAAQGSGPETATIHTEYDGKVVKDIDGNVGKAMALGNGRYVIINPTTQKRLPGRDFSPEEIAEMLSGN